MKYSRIRKTAMLIMVLLLASCGSSIKQSDLIGKWTEETGSIVEGLPLKSIEFFEDGKVMIADQYPGTFKLLDNGELEVTLADGVYSDPVKIEGSKLTITQDDGDAKSYIKQ